MTTVLVLGAGTAGTIVANKLVAQFPQLDVTVVDQDNVHHYQPGYLFLPFGIYDNDKITRPRTQQLNRRVQFVEASIDRVDPLARKVYLDDAPTLNYDYLIIATGVAPRPDQTPGLTEALGDRVHEFYTFEGAQKLRTAMHGFEGGNLVVHITEMPIKCPVAPMEFTFLADDFLDRKACRRRTTLTYVTPLDGAFTKQACSDALGGMLDDKGISLVTDFNVASVDGSGRILRGFDGREIAFDLLVTVPVNMGAEYIDRSGLGNELNLVPCDKHTMQSDAYENIFVLGDAGTFPTSKAGSVAHFQIDVFCDNFRQLLAGQPMTHTFDGHANCFIESGYDKALLIDFNYDTEPLPGTFPLPGLGPMTLLGESRVNHWGKLAFRLIYWNLLLPGRPLGLPANMSMRGKKPLA